MELPRGKGHNVEELHRLVLRRDNSRSASYPAGCVRILSKFTDRDVIIAFGKLGYEASN
jgi:hypothetical protein